MMNDTRYFGLGAALLAALAGVALPISAQEQDSSAFDYADYAAVLKTYVDDKGMVDYRGLKASPEKLIGYVEAMSRLPRSRYEGWSDDAKIAFWLNAYNGLTLKAIIDNYPIKSSFFKSAVYPKNSIRQIGGVWDKLKFPVMGQKLTLEHIEHKILRVQFNEPRIHMALVCAAMGCPTLRNEPYAPGRLDEQLDDQTRDFLGNRSKFRIDRGRKRVYLSAIFKWFGKDFVKTYGPSRNLGRHDKTKSSALSFVAGYLDESDKSYVTAGNYRVAYLDYDWSLNEQKRR
jgi:hypothetical protein